MNGHLLHVKVQEPWVIAAADEDIELFLDRHSCDKGIKYEDVQDHLLFNFYHKDDLRLFLRKRELSELMAPCLAPIIWKTMLIYIRPQANEAWACVANLYPLTKPPIELIELLMSY